MHWVVTCWKSSGMKPSNTSSPYDQKLTVSIGVASAVPAKNISVQWLIETADRALYLAKHNGRARVEEASLD